MTVILASRNPFVPAIRKSGHHVYTFDNSTPIALQTVVKAFSTALCPNRSLHPETPTWKVTHLPLQRAQVATLKACSATLIEPKYAPEGCHLVVAEGFAWTSFKNNSGRARLVSTVPVPARGEHTDVSLKLPVAHGAVEHWRCMGVHKNITLDYKGRQNQWSFGSLFQLINTSLSFKDDRPVFVLYVHESDEARRTRRHEWQAQVRPDLAELTQSDPTPPLEMAALEVAVRPTVSRSADPSLSQTIPCFAKPKRAEVKLLDAILTALDVDQIHPQDVEHLQIKSFNSGSILHVRGARVIQATSILGNGIITVEYDVPHRDYADDKIVTVVVDKWKFRMKFLKLTRVDQRDQGACSAGWEIVMKGSVPGFPYLQRIWFM